MEVALDGAHGAAQGFGQGLHLGPAQTTLVVSVVREGAVGRDRLGGDTGEDEGLDLGDSGKSGLVWHRRLLFLVRRCALMIEFTKAAVPQRKGLARRFFYALFTGAYFTYLGIVSLAPEPLPPPCAPEVLILPYGSGPGEKENPQHDHHRPNHRSGDLDSVVYGDSGLSC